MKLKLKDPGSAITHGIAMLLAVAGATPLIVKAARSADILHVFAVSVFILTMILLYLASTLYHSVNSTAKVNRRLKKMDHMMIFVMIAGSYTPVCLIVLHGRTGYILCALVWTVAIIGMILKGCWINCPKWLSSVIYIGMGWLCVLAFVPIFHNLPRAGFGWLLAGGIIYTIGGVIYALKLPIFNAKHKNFGSHEVFHIFVMLGSVCHFVVMYFFVAGMGSPWSLLFPYGTKNPIHLRCGSDFSICTYFVFIPPDDHIQNKRYKPEYNITGKHHDLRFSSNDHPYKISGKESGDKNH